jgi:hypothetical protein
MITFTVDGKNILSIYHSATREGTITEIIKALPVIDDDLKKPANAAIRKLQTMTDDEYDVMIADPCVKVIAQVSESDKDDFSAYLHRFIGQRESLNTSELKTAIVY